MVPEVWLIEEASGPVQLHRSAIVTALDELAAPAGAAGMMATLAALAMASVAVANAAIFARTITCTPLCPPAAGGLSTHHPPFAPAR